MGTWSVGPLSPRGGVGIAHSHGYIARCALGIEHAPLVLACGLRAVLAVLAISGYLLLRILTRPLHVHCAYLRIYTLHTAPSICYIGFTLHCILINRFGSKLHYCVAIIHVTHILNLKQTSILSIVK